MAKKKIIPLLVEKYDISHKILNQFVDLESRHMLFSIIKKPKSAQEISKELKIPLSSVYKKIQELNVCSLVSEKSGFSEKGPIVTFYQSLIKDVKISITKFEPSISFTKKRNVKDE